MGVKISDLITSKPVEVKDLENRKIAVDGFNTLYQFLTTIRMRDGTPLKDSGGNVTSHLSGLFSRVSFFLQNSIEPIFVFDGEAPDLKKKERERRYKLKECAKEKYDAAVREGNVEDMRKYAQRTSRLTAGMVDESKHLLDAFGVPYVQAPSEGEAQASFMVKRGDAYAVASQDFDVLLFGAPRLIKDFSVSPKRKMLNKLTYQKITPQLFSLSDVLNELGVDQDQLVVLGLLIGTDFNVGGIKGVGPKKALNLIKQYGDDFDNLFKDSGWEDYFDYPWTEPFYLIKKMPVDKDYIFPDSKFNPDKILEVMCEDHDFSRERISSTLEKIGKKADNSQKNLGKWF